MTMKRHPFESLADLEIRGSRLHVHGKPVGSGRFMLNGPDWERLARAIDDARNGINRDAAASRSPAP